MLKYNWIEEKRERSEKNRIKLYKIYYKYNFKAFYKASAFYSKFSWENSKV